jgi:hypothetical protein
VILYKSFIAKLWTFLYCVETVPQHLYMEYISLSWSNIPDHVSGSYRDLLAILVLLCAFCNGDEFNLHFDFKSCNRNKDSQIRRNERNAHMYYLWILNSLCMLIWEKWKSLYSVALGREKYQMEPKRYYLPLYSTVQTSTSRVNATFKIRVITTLPNSEQSYKGKIVRSPIILLLPSLGTGISKEMVGWIRF